MARPRYGPQQAVVGTSENKISVGQMHWATDEKKHYDYCTLNFGDNAGAGET